VAPVTLEHECNNWISSLIWIQLGELLEPQLPAKINLPIQGKMHQSASISVQQSANIPVSVPKHPWIFCDALTNEDSAHDYNNIQNIVPPSLP
jgi:hypothetical protein